MAQVWKIDLPPMEKLVLLALADCANDEGKAWPAASTLMRKTNASESSVRRAVQSLIATGHLQQHQRPGTSPVYLVHPCHSDTPVTVTPLSPRQGRGVTMTPKPSRTINTSGAKAPSVSRAMPFPGEGYSTDDQKMTQEHALRVLCITWAVTEMQWTTQDAGAEFLRFKDSALAADRRYKDWLAAWRNWCRSPFQKTKPADDHDNFKWGKMPKLDHARAVAPKPTVLVPVRD